jgi:hypothetical protein
MSTTGPDVLNIPKQPTRFSMNWWLEPTKVTIPGLRLVVALVVFVLFILSIVGFATFENKYYDPYGTGIRHYISRDDTGAVQSSLEERQFGSKPLKIEPLTSTPESPNFSEYYGIEANLKDGSVMIERENFENSALDLEQLEKANKGL